MMRASMHYLHPNIQSKSGRSALMALAFSDVSCSNGKRPLAISCCDFEAEISTISTDYLT